MDMSGSQRIEAPREKVWEGLNNPDVLKQCIPGCESIEQTSPSELAARAVLTVERVAVPSDAVVRALTCAVPVSRVTE